MVSILRSWWFLQDSSTTKASSQWMNWQYAQIPTKRHPKASCNLYLYIQNKLHGCMAMYKRTYCYPAAPFASQNLVFQAAQLAGHSRRDLRSIDGRSRSFKVAAWQKWYRQPSRPTTHKTAINKHVAVKMMKSACLKLRGPKSIGSRNKVPIQIWFYNHFYWSLESLVNPSFSRHSQRDI